MIRVIFGEKGAGKTKRIIQMANESLNTAKGSIVYIDNDTQYMFELNRSIRFVDASEFRITGPKMLYGFLAGVAAQDYDLEYIYIDGFKKIVKHDSETLQELFSELDAFASKNDIKLIISIGENLSDAPEFLKPYSI